MRIPAAVLRWLSAGILALAVLLAIAGAAFPVLAADTGTYEISSYYVTLEPQPDGQVRITVEQIWRALSGHIPWVTVGLPNKHFVVEDYGSKASKVSPANSGGFTGVRVDLDRDYQAGETFGINFTVLQNNLLERLPKQGVWRIDYTPGWYDRATIDSLSIQLNSPVDYQTYSSVSPMPAGVEGNYIHWFRDNIPPGGRFEIKVESTDGSFLTAAAPSTGSNNGLYIGIGIIAAVALLAIWGVIKLRQANRERQQRRVYVIEQEMAEDEARKKEIEEGFQQYVDKKHLDADDEGRYYDRGYGGYVTPAIWAALIATRYNRPIINPGAEQRTGCVACACVSCACACACACAGGGAAGCSHKTLHECPACREKLQIVPSKGKAK
jgi:hypothetical protein